MPESSSDVQNKENNMTGIEPLLLTVDETRKILGGRGRGHIYTLIDEGKVESVKDGSRRFILADSVRRYVDAMHRDDSRTQTNQDSTELNGLQMNHRSANNDS